MARVRYGPGGIRFMRGSVGEMTYRHCRSGSFASSKPDMSNVEWSEAQQANRADFKEANEYAKKAMQDPELAAIYQEKVRRKKGVAYRAALRDYKLRPRITRIDLSDYAGAEGDLVEVTAHDDTTVIAVYVRLSDASGAVLEEGEAVQLHTGRWQYTAAVSVASATTVRVQAAAYDLPGNPGFGEEHVEVEGSGVGVASAEEGATTADGGFRESVEVARDAHDDPRRGRILHSPEVRRARRRRQRRTLPPEVQHQGRETSGIERATVISPPELRTVRWPEDVPVEREPSDPLRSAENDDTPAASSRASLNEAVEGAPVRDDKAISDAQGLAQLEDRGLDGDSLARVRELLHRGEGGLDLESSTSLHGRTKADVELARELLLLANHLLRTQDFDEDGAEGAPKAD